MRFALVLSCLWLGCAPPKPPAAPTPDQVAAGLACREAYDRAIETSSSCPEAQLKVDSSEVCRSIGGINLHCKEHR